MQDLTVTAAHPHYCSASLQPHARASFTRRLAALWQQFTTPAERCVLENAARLPARLPACLRACLQVLANPTNI